MSTPSLVNACPVCGAEESLDALLLRMIADEEARALIYVVITLSFPLGSDVVRYLRLHTPTSQKLRMSTISKVLAELVPDVQRTAIEHKGRIWAVSPESWRAAFRVIFDAAERGTLSLPLRGNGYLYGVLVKLTDRQEAALESEREQTARQRTSEAGPRPVGDLVAEGLTTAPSAARIEPEAEQPAADPEAAARAADIRRKLADDLAARRARQQSQEAQP